MKFVLTFFISLFFLSATFAQKEKDSLFQIWHNINIPDSTRFNVMSNLIDDHYLFKKTDSALILVHQMLDLAQSKKNIRYEVEAQTLLGKIYFEKKENEKAKTYYTTGLELALSIKDSFLYANKLLGLGSLEYTYEDYTNAFKTLQKSQTYSEKIGDSLNLGWSIAYQGFIFTALGDYQEAEKYHLNHLRLSKKYGIKRSISGANGNLGNVYKNLGNIPKSIKHWKEGIRIAKEIGLPLYAVIGTGNLISIYIDEKDYENASKYLEEYISVLGHLKNPEYHSDILLFQCQIEYGLGNYIEALKKCNDCIKIYDVNNWDYDTDILKSLYEINKKLNNHALALNYFEKYQELIDNENENKSRTEIQNIIFNNQLSTDSIAKAQEKESLSRTYKAGLLKKNRERNLFLILGFLVLLLGTAYFIIYRKIETTKRKRLREINTLKNALFTNITHEFRTPLTVIKGMTDAIKSDLQNKKPEGIQNSLEMIERNSNNLLHLVNEMLDLSKLESGNMELQLIQSDIIPFIKYLGESFSSYALENDIKLTIYCEIESLIMDFDGNKLTSIVSNLLSNAIKFTEEQGKIIVHINKINQKDQSYLSIKIKDSGIGIASEELPNIFNRFYQTDASTVRKNEGTGIGLALTKELVELMNGTIEVKSKLSKGSEFSVKIPITNNAKTISQVPQTLDSTFQIIRTKSKQVAKTQDTAAELPLLLIIEDNMDVAHYLKTCLKSTYETIHAVNGIEGIEIALEKIPDIIICDVMMPGKDGFEVCKTLKNDERSDHIPIIILTAKATFEDKLKGLSIGADAYLAKPFNKEELFTRLDQLILVRKKLMKKLEKSGYSSLLNEEFEDPQTKFLKQIIESVHTHLDDANFGATQLAKELHLSESQIYRKLKSISDKSTAIFIRTVRLQKAKELLQTSSKSVSEIAYVVGFSNPSWFSRAFKDEFGYPPSEEVSI
ncbi:ATP-binding protein [uncultured Maribacter sp.]|uniref:hybrid sensor histidine kinase/response regulator transcription factor n=1 Tax=uncultured Maribacter sp. TaxID=431308 RepID=UPI0030EB258C|tara:strand:+ start:7969 stop:10827 length:2859 start_codon:yes stop_codon:yes gene_type:complete